MIRITCTKYFFISIAISVIFPLLVNAKYDNVLNIAHRGSSGEEQEHTEAAYKLAIKQGADFIECDICLTKDLVPICLHDCNLNHTTDIEIKIKNNEIESIVEKYDLDGIGKDYNYYSEKEDYFSSSYDWKDIQKLLIKREQPTKRNIENDLTLPVCSFENFLKIAKEHAHIGVYPELKYPDWVNSVFENEFNSKKTSFEKIVIDLLLKYGYNGKSAKPNVYIQTFNKESAKKLAGMNDHIPIIFLTFVDPKPKGNYTLKEIADFTAKRGGGIGVWKPQIFENATDKNKMKNVSKNFVKEAHDLGMKVHVYTFRLEDENVPYYFGNDIRREYLAYLEEGVDGLFTDYPFSLTETLKCLSSESSKRSNLTKHKNQYDMEKYIFSILVI